MRFFVLSVLAVASLASAPPDDRALSRQFQEAIDLMETKGDCRAAIRLFQETAQASDRNLQARSLLHMGSCYEKLDKPAGVKIYNRLAREFTDQPEIASLARGRLARMDAAETDKPAGGSRFPWIAPRVVATIPVGGPTFRVAITPDGGEVYASLSDTDTVIVIETRTNQITHRLRVGSRPNTLAVSPDGTRVYVAQEAGGLSVINTATKVVIPVDSVAQPVADLAFIPDGKILYMAMQQAGLKRLDCTTHKVKTVSGAVCPTGLAITPDGRFLYVSYQCGGPGGWWGHDAIGRFDASTGEYLGSITGLPHVGSAIATSPDGNQVWANGNDACLLPAYDHAGCPFVPARVVHVIQAGTDKLIRSIGFSGFWPNMITILPDSLMAAVGNQNNLLFFDTQTFEVAGSIPLPSFGGLAFTPDGARAYTPVPDEKAVAVLQIFTPVRIEILPGIHPNTIRLGAEETIPVAIFGGTGVHPTSIDLRTISLAGAPVKLGPGGEPMASFADPEHHREVDRLVVHIDAAALQLKPGDTQAVLEGRTSDGIRVRGVDTVRVEP